MTPFLLPTGGNAYFFWTSKFVISGLECRRMFLSTVNLTKFDELDHFSSFNKRSPNSIQSDPGPLERIIRHFWNKFTTQQASVRSRYDCLLTEKNCQKKISCPKMVEIGLVEISAPPKSTFLGWGGQKFFGPHQMRSIKLKKCFHNAGPISTLRTDTRPQRW